MIWGNIFFHVEAIQIKRHAGESTSYLFLHVKTMQIKEGKEDQWIDILYTGYHASIEKPELIYTMSNWQTITKRGHGKQK